MLNLDQIKQLEMRVSKAIEVMQSLKDENELLKLELHDRQKRIDELESIVLVFKNDQAKIEEGIVNALNHLSAFEDTVYQAAHTTAVTETSSDIHETVTAVSAAEKMETAQEGSEKSQATVVSVTVTQSDSAEASSNSNQMEIF
jgi:uncharacterized protein TP_0847